MPPPILNRVKEFIERNSYEEADLRKMVSIECQKQKKL